MALYQNIRACRICSQSELVELMAFGEQFLASTFVESNEGHPMAKIRVPLTVVMCSACKTVQLKEDVDRDALFTDYFYRSGTNPMMRAALEDVVQDVESKISLSPGDVVLDIGCNDATMLLMYPSRLSRMGMDPASNLDWSQAEGKAVLINDYFSKEAFLAKSGGKKAKAVTTIAMLYNIAQLDRIVGDIAASLANDGVWCIQLSYLPSLLDTLSFYDVCHEHLYYFSMETLERLLDRHGLHVFDASTNGVNGGSLRVFCSHREQEKSAGYLAIRASEEKRRLDDPATYRAFFAKVLEMREKIVGFLEAERAAGRTVVGLGASTKGNVLLQFFGIDARLVPAISERNPEKCGLYTLGTDIAVISEEEARAMKPSAMLVLIWFFRDELLRREKSYLAAGGKLLFPMPYPNVVDAKGETRL
jgi:NDP-4-keto-2,6-dideoxyhexose 3-C-methyltransferase